MMKKKIRKFKTGATRDTDSGKLDYEGFFSPIVLQEFAAYMHRHRIQSDGKLRNSDSWQRGIPREEYMKSAWRHFMDWYLWHRGHENRNGIIDALMGLLFNVMGYSYEILTNYKKNNLLKPMAFSHRIQKVNI